MFDNQNKPKGLKRVYLATLNSTRAFKWLLDNESAFRQELVLLVFVIPMTFLFDITIGEQLTLVIAVLFIIFTEIINTAIEAVVDRIGLEFHPLSGLAEDLGSAAVLISIFISVGVWAIVLL